MSAGNHTKVKMNLNHAQKGNSHNSVNPPRCFASPSPPYLSLLRTEFTSSSFTTINPLGLGGAPSGSIPNVVLAPYDISLAEDEECRPAKK